MTSIAITGRGLLSAAGNGMAPLCRSIENGFDHVAPLRNVDVADLPNQRGAEIRDPSTPRFARYLELALEGAIQEAGLLDRARSGLAVGTTLGRVDELARPSTLEKARESLALDACVDHAARRFDLARPVTAFSLACASGVCACEHACAQLALDRADAMLVGGVDTLGRFMQAGFCSLRGFAPESSTSQRVTFALGEGAAFVTLERVERARARGAACFGVLESQRLVADGYHLASPDPSGDGMARAITEALDDAELTASDVGAAVLTAIGSPFHERMLQRVLTRALGRHADDVPVTTHEPTVGHMLAASGIVVMAYATHLLEQGNVPRAFPIDALAFGLASSSPSSTSLDAPHVLALSVGFGGFNGVAIIGRTP